MCCTYVFISDASGRSEKKKNLGERMKDIRQESRKSE